METHLLILQVVGIGNIAKVDICWFWFDFMNVVDGETCAINGAIAIDGPSMASTNGSAQGCSIYGAMRCSGFWGTCRLGKDSLRSI